jgi:prolyl oligopeptidase
MWRRPSTTLLLLGLVALPAPAQQPIRYPAARQVDQADEYHGTTVRDPYRWLEETESAEAQQWIAAENQLTAAHLATIPEREAIRRRLTELWNYERYSAPTKVGTNYIYTRNDGLQNQSVWYLASSIRDTGRVFFDPNALSADGTAALSGSSFSDDGTLWAYGIARSGSDRTEWRVMNVATGEHLPDQLRPNRQGGVSWLKDNSGFYYSRFPDAEDGAELKDQNFFQKLYFHRLGTLQSADVVVYERPDNKEYFVNGRVTEDGEWLVITVGKGTERMNMVYVQSLTTPDAPVQPLVTDLGASYSLIGNEGSRFYFQTDRDAPMGQVVAVDVSETTPRWEVVVPEAEEMLRGVSLVHHQFVLNYLQDAYTRIRIVTTDGQPVREVELPGIGTAGGFGGKATDSETFYTWSSFNAPPTIYRYDMATGTSELYRSARVAFDPSDIEVSQVFYASKDGTRVPMFLVHKKGIALDGTNPTLLYGYGGFNIAQTPGFSVARIPWLEMGGVYAVANIRGGNEYGKKWWQGGSRLKKQNVFDDFIAAAEWLIAKRYTSPAKLAIQGGSNGGLLVGAVLNQRPELFGAALPAVGVMDMVRFPKFTIGWAWTSDYGSPDDPTDFRALYAYSPLHNIRAGGKYPATMITTADHDDRVFPAHSFKYAAALQAAQGGTAPILIRIETKAGHGAGKPTAKVIEEQADLYGFLVRHLGVVGAMP